MANYNNLENGQEGSFDDNYGQRLLSVSRQNNKPSKIVSPNLSSNRGFNASSAVRRNERRAKDELPPDAKETTSNEEMPRESISDKVKEKAVNAAASKLPPGLKGVGKNAMNNLFSGGNSSKVDQALFKAQKFKIYLIAGSIFFGFLLFIAIIFAVTSTGGTEASGAGFNEVSEYELEQDDSEETVTDDTEDPTPAATTTQPDIKGEGNEGLTE